jgi:hypothetical protein
MYKRIGDDKAEAQVRLLLTQQGNSNADVNLMCNPHRHSAVG